MSLRTLAALVLLLLAATPARADGPPLTIVVPFAAGGPTDALARALAAPLAEALGRKVVVRNVDGAGGTIGAERVAKAKPDGNTLLLSNIGHATSVWLYTTLRYHPVEDFAPIGMVAEVPMTLVGKPGLTARTVDEFKALARAEGNRLSIAHAGVGSASYLCGLLLMDAMRAEFTSVPYRGTRPAVTDVMNGHVDLLCDQTTHTLPFLKAGRLTVLGVSARARLPELPAVPTLDEAGLPGFDLMVWHGLYAPKGTPPEAVAALVAGLRQALASPRLAEAFAGWGARPADLRDARPEALGARLADEVRRWGAIFQKATVYVE
ncbi:MAG TPA: tripartite tricarboxylate transporter substrate-binding protein [Azospirillum sp.]|nr:tripartite tricarboxylate transporter substrate-binding protein [Azospirillum sp.]